MSETDLMEDAIRFERVTKAFDGHTVLDEVTFRVPMGSAFCLLGRSGVGKSVTLKLLIGLLRPDGGDVVVRGRRVPSLSPQDLSALRHRMGFLFQQSRSSIRSPSGRTSRSPSGAARASKRARSGKEPSASSCRSASEDNTTRCRRLSPAECENERGLARALAMDPEVVLVDEPSAGLDPITSVEIDELLLKLKSEGGTTMVIVTHNIPSARRIGDRLALLENGRIHSEGTVSDLERSEDEMVRHFMHADTGG